MRSMKAFLCCIPFLVSCNNGYDVNRYEEVRNADMVGKMDESSKREIEQNVNEFLVWLERNEPEISNSLNEGVSEQEFNDYAAQLELSPQEIEALEPLRILYKKANGQKSDEVTSLFHEGYSFISLDDSLAYWKMLLEIYKEGMVKHSGQVVDGVRLMGWHPKRIPFAQNIAGDALCIDMIPAESGTHGQVIEYIHDDAATPLVAKSLGKFLSDIVSDLKSGKRFYDHELGYLRYADEDINRN